MKSILIIALSIFIITGCSSSKKKAAEKTPQSKDKQVKPAGETAAATEKPHWGYEGLFGPELWGNLDPSFNLCKDGKTQSPVNLIWKKSTQQGPIQFKYKSQNLSLIDDGHALKVDVAPGSMANIRGEDYSLLNISLRTPSEHALSNKLFDAEIQFAHKNTKGELAMVSILVKTGSANTAVESILGSVPTKKNEIHPTKIQFDPNQLLPKETTYYQYMGSITTPPCTEGVNWNVLNSTIEMSAEQLSRLKAIYSVNSRPLQNINGRTTTNY